MLAFQASRTLAIAASACAFALSVAALPVAAASVTKPSRDGAVILLEAGSRSTMVHGSLSDLAAARALRRGGEALLYVRHDGRAYVIRDAATVREAEAIFRPQAELGRRQGELGSRQGALGTRQAALGRRQAEIGLRQASAGRSDGDSRLQDELGRLQDELGRQQEALGRQQSALGREQERLGREAAAKIRALVEDALRRGVAQPV